MQSTLLLTTGSVSAPLSDVTAEELGQAISAAASGRLSRTCVRRLHRGARRTPAAVRMAIESEPEKYLGLFDSLSEGERRALVEAIAEDDRQRADAHRSVRWHVVMVRALRRVSSKIRPRSRPAARLLEVAVSFLQGLPGAVYAIRCCQARLGPWVSRPTLLSALRAARIDPRTLAVCYARGIPQIPMYRGFWHDPNAHDTIGVIVGIDLLPHAGGHWYLESNLNPALRPARSALYERDPFVYNLLDFALEQGYRHLVVMINNSMRIDGRMTERYQSGAAKRGIRLTLVDDVAFPDSPHRQQYELPDMVGDRTLIARIKAYRTSLDYLLADKRATARLLRLYLEHSPEPALRVPPTGPTPVLGEIDPVEPFPNLVFKLPQRDAGTGVVFLKAMAPADVEPMLGAAMRLTQIRGISRFPERLKSIMQGSGGVFQPYLRPPLGPDRRAYIIRAHVLITPFAAAFLSAHRVVSGRPIPHTLPVGIVHDRDPFLVNYSAGARYELAPADEERAAAVAALGVARGLQWAASYGFVCNPQGPVSIRRP